jgi:hypothetical protein
MRRILMHPLWSQICVCDARLEKLRIHDEKHELSRQETEYHRLYYLLADYNIPGLRGILALPGKGHGYRRDR